MRWRYGTTSAALALATLLSACAQLPVSGPASDQPQEVRQSGATKAEPISSDAGTVADQPGTPESVAATTQPEKPAPPHDFWARLAAGFAFAQCEDTPASQRSIHSHSDDAEAYRTLFRRALPALMYVQGEVERRGLPGEFALLPLVESEYVPAAGPGGVAGVWQLMPETAREHGLGINREYDGRMDLAASTATALDLIAELRDEFPQDWRLVDMAYNAGHYRVAMAVSARERRGLAPDPEQLALARTTHEHVARLEALACIVRDPARYSIRLPEANDDIALATVVAAPGLDFELAARLSGLEMGRLRALNPGFLKHRVPRTGSYTLVLPRPNSERLTQALAQIPAGAQGSFYFATLSGSAQWDALAARARMPPALLAALNGADPGQAIQRGTRLYLPAAAWPSSNQKPELP